MSTDTPFKLDRFVPYRLSVAANAVSDTVGQAYRSHHKLRTPEWRVLAVLAEDGALTPLAIGQRTRMDKVTVSRASVTLIERGLITRSDNPVDLRSHLLSLSPRGIEVYQDVVPRALATQRQIFADFSADEITTLMDLLQRAEKAASTPLPSA